MNADTISSVHKEIAIDQFTSWVGIQTQSGKDEFAKRAGQWVSDPGKLKAASRRFSSVQKSIGSDSTAKENIHDLFGEFAHIEPTIRELLNNVSELEKETYGELFFLGSYTKALNFIPYFLVFWSMLRIYIFPCMSILFPLIVLIFPYIFMRYMFRLPITIERYIAILHAVVSGNTGGLLSGNIGCGGGGSGGVQEMSWNSLFRGVWILIPICQSFIQPYWSFKHLLSVDTIVRNSGKVVEKFYSLYDRLVSRFCKTGLIAFQNPLPCFYTTREAVANILIHPSYFRYALKLVGRMEASFCLATKKCLNAVEWVNSETPVFEIENTYDYHLTEEKKHPFSINLSKKNHVLLTGPNKGGKSTVLRATVLSALLAHTYGCALGTKCKMTPFNTIFVCIKPEDLPGAVSRFEKEICFTVQTLRTLPTSRALVFIDELFHSTNPPDALEACKIYCNQLWDMKNTVSIISTHIFGLVEDSNEEKIQKLCCSAEIDDVTGKIHFLYDLVPGICKISSVHDILKTYGLLDDSIIQQQLRLYSRI